jgi:O-antigen ligase
MSLASSLKAALRSPLLPYWLVVALLPFGRSAELGTLLCAIGTLLLFVRQPHALQEHAGARLLLWLLGAYTLAAACSALDSIVPGKSWGTAAALLRYAPLGLYACFALRRDAKLQAFYLALAGVLAVWVLDAWVQALTGWGLRGQAEAERISGIFGATDLKLGPSLAVLSPFALWTARRYYGRAGLIGAALLLLGPVLLAGARSAWLCYALVLLAFIWNEASHWRRFALWCALGLAIVGAAGALAWHDSARFQTRLQRTLLAFDGSPAALNQALTGRLDIWQVSARMIEGHPLNGVGVRGFRYAYPQYASAEDHFIRAEPCGPGEGACHAHQLLLEILTETGVIGLLCWLAGLVLALRAWRRVGAAARARAFPVSVALGVMLFPLNTHLAFYSAWWGLLFGWLLGLWCAALYVQAAEDGDGS